MTKPIGKGVHVEVFIRRDDGGDIEQELYDRIVRKVVALLNRLGCTPHGRWRIGPPPDVEDRLG